MILVDFSVWTDDFRGKATPRTDKRDVLLGTEPLAIGAVILVDVLQGFSSDRDCNAAMRLLTTLTVIDLAGADSAVQAAQNFRSLRALGISVRKTIDVVVAPRRIETGDALVHSDRDFDPFAEHLGLVVA